MEAQYDQFIFGVDVYKKYVEGENKRYEIVVVGGSNGVAKAFTYIFDK